MKRIKISEIGQSAAKTAVIYLITNKINGKVYVGQTIQSFAARKAEHKFDHIHGNGGTRALYSALRKYGLENFEFIELFYPFDKKDLDEFEIYFIKNYDSYGDKGYNMTHGGNAFQQTSESKQKISASLTGRKTRHLHSDEWWKERSDKIWETRRKRSAENPGIYKDMRDVAKRGSDHPQAKTYTFRFPNGEIKVIKGLGQFCRDNNLDYRQVLYLLKGEMKSVKGFTAVRFND